MSNSILVKQVVRLTEIEIDALKKGDTVWQIGEKQHPDRELTVTSQGARYIKFTRTIYFDRKYQRLSNYRFMYRTQEDLERDKLNLQRIKKITEILSSGNPVRMDDISDLLSAEEVADLYDRMRQRWPGEFKDERREASNV